MPLYQYSQSEGRITELTTSLLIAFSRNERTHPNLVSQAREIEISCGYFLRVDKPKLRRSDLRIVH